MILARLLAEDGHPVGACLWCGAAFPRDVDHRGRRHAPTRLYCRPRCRALAAAWRRLPRRRHARQWAWLTQLHEAEEAGQQPFPGQPPLPDIPPLQEAPA